MSCSIGVLTPCCYDDDDDDDYEPSLFVTVSRHSLNESSRDEK